MFYAINSTTDDEIITTLRRSFAKIDFAKEYEQRLQAYLAE